MSDSPTAVGPNFPDDPTNSDRQIPNAADDLLAKWRLAAATYKSSPKMPDGTAIPLNGSTKGVASFLKVAEPTLSDLVRLGHIEPAPPLVDGEYRWSGEHVAKAAAVLGVVYPREGKLVVVLPQHQQLIEASTISPEVAAARGYRSVSRSAELRALGFGRQQLLIPALLIPVWTVEGLIGLHQLRPDRPRLNKDGKPVKYETPAKARMRIDVPPAVLPQLADPGAPLYITEGARKADAAVSKGLCCIALLGVWNWRGRNRLGGTTALADWESIALKGREIILAFDSDVTAKRSVRQALVRLQRFLGNRGARVRIVHLPECMP